MIGVVLFHLLVQIVFCVALEAPLTAEERELLMQFEDKESSLLKPLEDLLETTNDELRYLTSSIEIIHQIQKENKNLEVLMEDISSETNEFEQRLVKFNQKQLEKLIDRIDKVLDTELTHREMQLSENVDIEDIEGIEGVTFDEIQKSFSTETVNSDFVSGLQIWVAEKLGEAWLTRIEEYISHGQELIDAKLSTLESQFEKSGKTNKKYCADSEKATKIVYSALSQLTFDTKTKGGLKGTSIVYGNEWTSDTYETNAGDVTGSRITLGRGMIRKYIPQDWERFFPAGWEDWNLSNISNFIPFLKSSYIFHSLPSHIISFLKLHFGVHMEAPVETILSSNNNLGSCWRFPGRNGKVTLRLSKPTVITNVTVAHYPWLESAHNPMHFKRHILSAPRFLRMVGYPPCDDNDDNCLDLQGFDVSKPLNLGSFEYKIDPSVIDDDDFHDALDDEDEYYEIPQSSVQTFVFSAPELIKNENDEELFSSTSSSGCSAVKPTCGGDDPDVESTSVVAVTLYIDENWGFEDYTCLYQVQLQGELE